MSDSPSTRAVIEKFAAAWLHLQPEEAVLLYSDEETPPETAGALEDYFQGTGHPCRHLALSGGYDVMTARLGEHLAGGVPAVLCELSDRPFYTSAAWRQALERGARIYALGALDLEGLSRCVSQIDPEAISRFSQKAMAVLASTRRMRISSSLGTDLRLTMNPHFASRLWSKIKGQRRSQIWTPTGLPPAPGQASLLPGQLAFLGNFDSIHGRVVVDGFLVPRPLVGRLSDPITLTVERGVVTRIEGPSAQASTLDAWLRGRPRNLKHLCLGYNPGARLASSMEAERLFGAVNFGFGDFPFHADGVATRMSVECDGRPLLEEGAYVHPALAEVATHLQKGFH